MLRGIVKKKTDLLTPLAMLLVFSSSVDARNHWFQRDSDHICYYVINNNTDSVLRVINILIDEEDVTEPKLRRLMDQFRVKYLEDNMLVSFYSKIDQYLDSQVGDIASEGPRKLRPKYPGGILIYRGADQVIRYKDGTGSLHSIVVKGVDPFANK